MSRYKGKRSKREPCWCYSWLWCCRIWQHLLLQNISGFFDVSRDSGFGIRGSGFGAAGTLSPAIVLAQTPLRLAFDDLAQWCLAHCISPGVPSVSEIISPCPSISSNFNQIPTHLMHHQQSYKLLKGNTLWEKEWGGGLHSPWDFRRNSQSQDNLTMSHLEHRNNSGRQSSTIFFLARIQHGSCRKK